MLYTIQRGIHLPPDADRPCPMPHGPVARLGPWPVRPRRPRPVARGAVGAVGRPALALSLSLTLYCNTAV